jgi:hypothetical protein
MCQNKTIVYHVIDPSFIPFQHIRSKFGLKINLWVTMNVQQFLSFLHILDFWVIYPFFK